MADYWRSDDSKPPFTTDEETAHGIYIIIECCDAVIRRTNGVSRDEFMRDYDMQDATAMDMTVIGNIAGRLPDEYRQFCDELNDAYGFRCRLAHDFRTEDFEMSYLWEAATSDVYVIRQTCADILDLHRTSLFTSMRNIKPGVYY